MRSSLSRRWRRPPIVGVALASVALALAAPARAAAPPVAEEPAAPPALTLAAALDYARVHQPALRVAQARIVAARGDAEVPRAQWKPTLGATAQLVLGTANNATATYLGRALVPLPGVSSTAANTARFQPYASTQLAIGVTQEIFDAGRIAAQAAAADALVDIERAEGQAALLDTDLRVREAFYAVLAAHDIVTVTDAAFERSEVHRDFARSGTQHGVRPQIELTRAEADLVRFDVARLRSRGSLESAESVFAAAVGHPAPLLDAAGAPPPLDDALSLQEALARAMQRDPTLREALARVRHSELVTRAIGAEARPDLSFTGAFAARAGGAPTSAGDVVAGKGWLPDVPNWDVGLVLSWPLYDPSVEARQAAARAREDTARAGVDRAREQEIAAVQQAYVALRVARTTLPGLERAVLAARENRSQAGARFREGLGTGVEIADAEALLTDAEIQLAMGKFELVRARAQLGRVIAERL